MALTPTVAAPPNTTSIATALLAAQAAQSGVLTDYNKGSQIRTLAESLGMAGEVQGIISQALAFQAVAYSAFSAYGITPNGATAAVGQVTLATSLGANPPVTNISVPIPKGTVIQTTNGVQVTTTQSAVLLAGNSSINIPAQAVQVGPAGNVAANTLTQLVSALPYPLLSTNLQPFTGGANAESPSSVLARFTAKVAAINGATPVAIANAVIGVTVASTAEAVVKATVYEPWIAQMLAGQAAPYTPGYAIYVDNGSGSASSDLLAAVQTLVDGSFPTLPGNRPAGVPYTVNAVVPLDAQVVVSGTPLNASTASTLTTNVKSAMAALFNNLNFGASLVAAQVNGAVANAVGGLVSGLQVAFEDGNGNAITSLVPAYAYQRIILQTLTINFGA